MVMYSGAEKAGIRLTDYAGRAERVGELMFCDDEFDRLKGKTDELFSVLFHRRFLRPELAYSETTAYPAQRLSARNMAAKLATSTIGDVRNTMFMSGLTALPPRPLATLAPAMKRHARLHEKLAGHTPRGPLKHFWGEASRYVGDDNALSLFLALGVPFEVTGTPAADGFTFLSDADALGSSAHLACLAQSSPHGRKMVSLARSARSPNCRDPLRLETGDSSPAGGGAVRRRPGPRRLRLVSIGPVRAALEPERCREVSSCGSRRSDEPLMSMA